MSAIEDARLALFAMAAEQVYQPAALSPSPPDFVSRAGWAVVANLTALDSILRRGVMTLSPQRVFYGWLLQNTRDPDEFLCVIRGTDGFIEWIEDAEFAREPHATAGTVESGFYGIYRSMLTIDNGNVIGHVKALVGTSGHVTVIGHSLGSAIATYLAFDLAMAMPGQVSARLFASPRPGDAVFAKAFDALLPDYIAYAYALDLVPRVPFGFGYCPLSKTTEITELIAQTKIRPSIFCNHHALSYAALLDKAAPSGLQTPFNDCLQGNAT